MVNHELDEWLARPDVQERLKPVQELQGVLLEMLKVIDGLCARHGLRYYLHGGTLLGAVRHGGFIPWDDDADISMPRPDYEKFLAIAKKELAADYFVQDYRTEKYGRFVFAKLRKNGTVCKNEHHAHIKMHQGIFIDIFPLDELPRNKFKAWCLWNVPRFFERLTAFSSARLPGALKVLTPFQKVWQCMFPPSFFAMLSFKTAIFFSGKGDGSRWLLTHDPNHKSIEHNSSPIADYEPARRMDFEGVSLRVHADPDAVLSHWYGDYMKLPPEEKRLPIHGTGKRRVLVLSIRNISNVGDDLIAEVTDWLIRKGCPDVEIEHGEFAPKRKDLVGLNFFENAVDYLFFGLERLLGRKRTARINHFRISVRSRRYFRKLIEPADAVVIAVGMLKYSTQSEATYFDIVTALADVFRKPVLLSGMSIEKPNSQDWRFRMLKNAVNRSSVKMITTRDGETGVARLKAGYLLRDIDIRAVGDPVLWARECFGMQVDARRDVVGLGLIRDNVFDDYDGARTDVFALYVRIIQALDERGIKWEIYSNGMSADIDFGVRLQKALGFSPERICPSFPTPRDYLNHIARYKCIFGGRLHANITACAMGVPFCGFQWEDKLTYFAEATGASSRFRPAPDICNDPHVADWIIEEFRVDQRRLDSLKDAVRSSIQMFLKQQIY